RPGRFSHVGVLGISVKDGYREAGIGQELMKEAERQPPRWASRASCRKCSPPTTEPSTSTRR
ncbi:MAG TPA: hypothetical protein VMW22_05220, partial [Candidatus Desulfaltia sp.]|nr:hypothetical protein [Candidatus Desulfaltia sp.]